MKTKPPLTAHAQKNKVPLARLMEWTVLVVLLAVGVFFFLKGNGFIDSSDIQPYPY